MKKLKGFNIDCHVGAKDAQSICELFGHDLTIWSISEHYFLHHWVQSNPDIVNKWTWKNLDRDMANAFYERYKNELNKYDFFYCFYSPTFSLLYEKFNKPIIMHVPLRYSVPFCNDPIRWNYFNEYCRRGIDLGQIIPLVTNKYDREYTKLFIERDFKLCQNLCEYTGAKYTGKNGKFLYCSKFKQFKDWIGNPNVIDKSQLRNHSWQDRADFKALIYVPYSNTLTTFFEDYTSNIPMLFPSKEYLKMLWKNFHHVGVMSELSFQQVNGLKSRSVIDYKNKNIPDPNDYMSFESFEYWMQFYDFYDEEFFPHIIHYDSLQDLENKLISLDFQEISDIMKEANKKREKYILSKWKNVFERIGG